MRRFQVPRSSWGPTISLPAAELHHAFHVLRLKPGDAVVIFDGQGWEVPTRILELDAVHGVVAPTDSEQQLAAGLRVVLGQGLPRGDKLEAILQHTTELGITEVWPLLLQRSVARPDERRSDRKLERWQRITTEAARQCRRADVPRVHGLGSLEAFCRSFEALEPTRRGLVLYEAASPGEELRAVLERGVPPGPEGVWLLVGPEGGLAPDEVARARNAGLEVAGLGPRILRTETAALAVLSILQFVWGDFRPT